MECKECLNGKAILMIGPIFQLNSKFITKEFKCLKCNGNELLNNINNNWCQCGEYYKEKITPHNGHLY
jgi:hypothetical protein